MNESEHINFFARHEFYIFSECKFSRDVNVNLVEVWFKFISSSLRTTLTLISWCQTTANKYGLFYFYLFNFTFGRWSVVLTLSFASSPASWSPACAFGRLDIICSRQFLTILLSQQIEGIEAMLDGQADQDQVTTHHEHWMKKDHDSCLDNWKHDLNIYKRSIRAKREFKRFWYFSFFQTLSVCKGFCHFLCFWTLSVFKGFVRFCQSPA